jgi:DNA-binding transcriptional LysR family regulator
MDLDQLTAFERITRERSFSQAAWELDIAQSTISARVQALEREIGGALFVRMGRRVALTDIGTTFLPYARRALEVLREGAEAAHQAQAGRAGQVTIGVLESLSGSFLGPALAHFQAIAPRVKVVVRAGRHEVLMELLRDGVIGLALIAWPCTDVLDTPLQSLLTLREQVVPVAAPAHPLARRRDVTHEELLAQAQPFLLLRWWQTLHPVIARLAQQAQAVIDVPMDTARHMVLHGVGVGFFTWMQVVDALAAGQLVQIQVTDLAPIARDSALVHMERAAPLAATAQALVATIRERAVQLGLLA